MLPCLCARQLCLGCSGWAAKLCHMQETLGCSILPWACNARAWQAGTQASTQAAPASQEERLQTPPGPGAARPANQNLRLGPCLGAQHAQRRPAAPCEARPACSLCPRRPALSWETPDNSGCLSSTPPGRGSPAMGCLELLQARQPRCRRLGWLPQPEQHARCSPGTRGPQQR